MAAALPCRVGGIGSRIDRVGRRKEAQAVVNLDGVVVLDLEVTVPGNDLEEVAVGGDRSRRDAAELGSRDLLLRPLVLGPVDSDGEYPGCGDEAQAVMNLDGVVVLDPAVRVAGNDLEEVAVGGGSESAEGDGVGLP